MADLSSNSDASDTEMQEKEEIDFEKNLTESESDDDEVEGVPEKLKLDNKPTIGSNVSNDVKLGKGKLI